MTLPGFFILIFLVAAILQPDKKPRKTASYYRVQRTARQSEKRLQRAAMLSVIATVEKKPRRARRTNRPAANPKAAQPAFLKDVESALQNLQYSKLEAKQAVKRATGDDFTTRLKNALTLLRIPNAKVTA